MKVKTSVTLSEELLEAIERVGGRRCSRSEFLEQATWVYLRKKAREDRYQEEVARLNAIADGLTGEPPDVEDYSAEVGDEIER